MNPDLTADDLYLFAEGTHGRLAEKLGAHVGPDGTSFSVWAPNAQRVSVVGRFVSPGLLAAQGVTTGSKPAAVPSAAATPIPRPIASAGRDRCRSAAR